MPLLYAAEKLGVTPEQALMIGDSVNDVTAARKAGFQVVCVPYGYNHGKDIRDAQPDAVINTLAELPALLQKAV
jgi:phosphoglycolate phosphatase